MILLKILQHFLLRIHRIRPKWYAICIIKCIAGALAQRSKILFKFFAKIITLSSTGGKLYALHADVFQGIHKADETACCGLRAFIQVNDIDFILRESLFLILQQMADPDRFISRYGKQIVSRIAVTQIVAFIFVFHRIDHNRRSCVVSCTGSDMLNHSVDPLGDSVKPVFIILINC